MFHFDGATFDPAGAENITQSSAYSAWVTELTKLKNQYPSLNLTINQGPDSGFINYNISGSAVSSITGSHIGNTYSLENEYVVRYFSEQLNGDPLNNDVIFYYEQMQLHSMDGIVRLMQAMTTLDAPSVFGSEIASWKTAASTGDIGVSDQAPDLGAINFFGTDGDNYL